MAITISYPTSASGIIVLLKTPTKSREFSSTLFVKTTDFQLEQTPTVNVFGEHGIMAKPIRAVKLHYSVIQFLIITITTMGYRKHGFRQYKGYIFLE